MSENEVSIRGKILREMIAHLHSDRLIGQKIKNGEFRNKIIEPQWKCPEGFQNTIINMEAFEMEFLEPDNKREDFAILQLHGGGYVGRLRNAHRSQGILYSSAGKGCAVLSIDYRVAPEHPFPAALEDAVAAFQWLLKKGYEAKQIVIGGDSAGGGLAMALCMHLRDCGESLPGGIVAMSPWTDLTAEGDSYTDNYEIDPVFGNTKDSLIYDGSYIKNADPQNPYISPVFGDFTGFPPMLIQVGTHEMLLSDSVTVAKKAKDVGVKVRFSQYEGMFHVFQRAMLLMPESRKAWIEVEKFIEKLAEL